MQASGLGPRAFRSAIFALDVGLRRASHAFEYDSSSECIFRISLGEAGRTCILDQGERLEPSDPVVDLHFWNEHMPAMSSSGPDVAWGRRMHRALCFSFSALALRLETDSGLKSAKAVRITTLIGQDGRPKPVSTGHATLRICARPDRPRRSASRSECADPAVHARLQPGGRQTEPALATRDRLSRLAPPIPRPVRDRGAGVVTAPTLSIGAALCAISAVGSAYVLACAAAIGRGDRRSRDAPSTSEPLTILVPLCGEDAGLFERLRGLCEQRGVGPVQLVCAVQSAADPAVPVVRRLAAALPYADISLKIDPRLHGSNRKISNLINAASLARHDKWVLIDGDVEAPRDHLAQVNAALADGIGAVTCLYRGEPRGGLWASVASLAIDAHFLPNVTLAHRLGLAHPCMGATIALSRHTLAEIGGLEPFVDSLDDDYALGAAVRRTGMKVAIAPSLVAHLCSDRSFGELFRHLLRAAQTTRRIDPLGHLGSIVTHPLPIALLALAAGQSAGAGLAALALGARFTLHAAVRRTFGARREPLARLALADFVVFAAFAASFSSPESIGAGRDTGSTRKGGSLWRRSDENPVPSGAVV